MSGHLTIDQVRVMFENCMAGLNDYHFSQCRIHAPDARCSCGLNFVKSAIRDNFNNLAHDLYKARTELKIIADAQPMTWEPEMRDQFQAWAQNRARDALVSRSRG